MTLGEREQERNRERRRNSRYERKRNRRRRTAVFLLVLIVLLGAAFAVYWKTSHGDGNGGGPTSEAGGAAGAGGSDLIGAKGRVELTITCVGDVMVHRPQIAAQYDNSKNIYDFSNNFAFIKPYIESADLSLCNVETTFAGGTPTGFPTFNSPDSLAKALADTGFDVGITANNHMMDSGITGLSRTLRVLREAGLATAGSRFEWERNYAMVRIKGLKIAVIPYTYETPSNGGRTTINSMVISSETEPRINSFNTETLAEDMKQVKKTIASARKRGADIIICYYHWGQEYQRAPDEWQQSIAMQTADMGADIIFASHPHVLQGMEKLSTTDGRTVPVFYSMGNFISNQRTETLQNRYTEQGMIARVQLEYDKSEKKVNVLGMDAMPTWVDKYRSGGKDVYAIVPLDGRMDKNQALAASGHLGRARQALEDVRALLGEEYIWKEEGNF